jgi:hypothetical protein
MHLRHILTIVVLLLLGNLDGYKNISTRLKIGPFEDDGLVRTASAERKRQQNSDEPESPGSSKPCMLFCSGIFITSFVLKNHVLTRI